MFDLPALVANEPRDSGGFAVRLPLLDEHSAFVDHTDARTVQRYVDPDEELHGVMLLFMGEDLIVGPRGAVWEASGPISASLSPSRDLRSRGCRFGDFDPVRLGRCHSGGAAAIDRRTRPDVMASNTLHVDDRPVPVLAPGAGTINTGRYGHKVRDERPLAGDLPPTALFRYSPDHKGEHPRASSVLSDARLLDIDINTEADREAGVGVKVDQYIHDVRIRLFRWVVAAHGFSSHARRNS